MQLRPERAVGLRHHHDRATDVTEAVVGLRDDSGCVAAIGHRCDGHGPRWGIMDGMHSQIAALTAGTWPVVVVETGGLWETKSLRTLLLTPPFLGPSSSMLLHRLAYTAPTRWTTEDLAEQLGVSPSKIVDGLDRLRRFRMITLTSDHILVPSHLGPLDERQLDFLPARFLQLHARLERP